MEFENKEAVLEVAEDTADAIDMASTPTPLELEANDGLVVEEDAAKDTLPGSDIVVVEEEQAACDTDWANDKDYSKFIDYLSDKLNQIPKHSGQTIPGCERALSYCKDLQSELSKAMRGDLGGKIDEQKADDMYKDLNNKIDRLSTQIDKLRTGASTQNKVFAAPEVRLVVDGRCDKCEGEVPTWHDVENDRVVCLKCNAVLGSGEMTKVAGTPVINVYVSPFERAIIGSLVNGSVSGGKNMEELFDKLDGKYKFSDREKLSIAQLLADYGFGMLLDRVKFGDKDKEDKNDGEFITNYNA